MIFWTLSFKTALSLVGIVFCVSTTALFVFMTVVWGGILGTVGELLTYRVLAQFMFISLSASLPIFVLVHNRPIKRTEWRIRQVIQYILTMTFVFGFFIYFDFVLRIRYPMIFVAVTILFLAITNICEKYYLSRDFDKMRLREREDLQKHLDALEMQGNAIRNFKCDYRNMLLFMEEQVQSKDFAELEKYFLTQVKSASECIAQSEFVLNRLDKIKVRPIKNILAAKLITAQNIHHKNVLTSFEGNEDIEHIPLDSYVLVRILTIILDNAIEALAELGGGVLFVGCFKWDSGITFIVKNTCPADLPPIQELWKPRFSTKKNHSGMGLANLSKFVDYYSNVTLQTNMGAGMFCQELLIENTAHVERGGLI